MSVLITYILEIDSIGILTANKYDSHRNVANMFSIVDT